MTTPIRPADETDAYAWAIRTSDPTFDDWAGFQIWLAADPANAERYDAILLSVEQAAASISTQPRAPAQMAVARPSASRRRGALPMVGAGVAAALIGAVGLSLWNGRPQEYAVVTPAGETRAIQLADGSRVTLAGGSRLQLDRAEPRSVTIETGTALFQVKHDARSPFVVRATGMKIVDLGTVFDVTHEAGVTRVTVGEGEVMVDPTGPAVRLTPGQGVRLEAGRLRRQQIVAADVGRWRDGVLSFDDATLGEVAAALSRTLKHPVTVTPAVSGIRFQGTLEAARIAHNPQLLGRLLGVRVIQAEAGWRLEPRR